jgi:hypothetical protein
VTVLVIVLFVLALLLHNGLWWVELPKGLNPFLLIDDSIPTDIDDLEYVTHDAEGRQGFICHLADTVEKFTELREGEVSHSAHIEGAECVLGREEVVMEVVAKFLKARLATLVDELMW